MPPLGDVPAPGVPLLLVSTPIRAASSCCFWCATCWSWAWPPTAPLDSSPFWWACSSPWTSRCACSSATPPSPQCSGGSPSCPCGGLPGVAVFCGVVAYWLLRFAISLSLGAWFVTTTRVSTLLAALNQLRAPRFLTIPLAVLFRFVPVALDEARGVMEAMRLRGYSGSYLWRHPLDGIEKLVVPVLAASARSADDLSAAALIRGLGSGGRPTVVDRLRFGAADAVLLALSAGLVVLALQPVWGR